MRKAALNLFDRVFIALACLHECLTEDYVGFGQLRVQLHCLLCGTQHHKERVSLASNELLLVALSIFYVNLCDVI